MHRWDAEVAIDAALVRHLVGEQFPEVDAGSARLLAEGWDNAGWLVEERWLFRFPRRAVAVPLLERERVLLPRLAPLVPLPVPVPVYAGRPDERYPWPFLGAELLPARELAQAGLADEERGSLATELGRFLRVLHTPDTLEAVDPDGTLPLDPNRRADTRSRSLLARESFAELERVGMWGAEARVESVLDDAASLPLPRRDPVLVHGDLHVRHVLIDDGAPSAVIDWGDAARADRSVDLLLFWSALPPAARERFLEAYGAVDEEELLRARVLALQLCAMLAVYAHHEGLESVQREALAGLERTLVD